jgi:hypothetical protein
MPPRHLRLLNRNDGVAVDVVTEFRPLRQRLVDEQQYEAVPTGRRVDAVFYSLVESDLSGRRRGSPFAGEGEGYPPGSRNDGNTRVNFRVGLVLRAPSLRRRHRGGSA